VTASLNYSLLPFTTGVYSTCTCKCCASAIMRCDGAGDHFGEPVKE
jgi:hypothetical protein